MEKNRLCIPNYRERWKGIMTSGNEINKKRYEKQKSVMNG
jgi:hypothetical protein